MEERYASPTVERGGAQISRSGVDARLTKDDRPTTLEELQHRLSDSIQATQDQANRVREFADSILGAEPSPTKTDNGRAEPPVAGRGNVLLDQARVLSQSLTFLREQIDRLNRI